MNKLVKFVRVSIPAAALSLGTAVYAAVPAEATTAMTDAKADGISVGGTLLGIAVAIWGVMFLKRKFFG